MIPPRPLPGTRHRNAEPRVVCPSLIVVRAAYPSAFPGETGRPAEIGSSPLTRPKTESIMMVGATARAPGTPRRRAAKTEELFDPRVAWPGPSAPPLPEVPTAEPFSEHSTARDLR